MHKHRANPKLERIVGWTHCVAKPSSCCSGAAHGAITTVEHCNCGAIRRTETNGKHSNTGSWEEPTT